MPMLFWLPMIILGGILNVALDAAWVDRGGSTPPAPSPDEPDPPAERAASRFQGR